MDINKNKQQFQMNLNWGNQMHFLSFIIKDIYIFGPMPELPEVETMRRFLQSVLLHPKPKKIKLVKMFYPGIIKDPTPSVFSSKIINQTFTQIDRYGKYLIIKLQDFSIISHLRMEGKYHWCDNKYKPENHDHIQFLMTDGNSLIYNDVRKFGTMHLVNKGEELQHPSIKKLGPEVNNEQTFTEEYFEDSTSKKIKNIKEVLLDQQVVCGIGNIYADQILFAAKVHPEVKCNKLNTEQISSIVRQSKKIIDRAIENKGTTIRSYSVNHQQGSNQNTLNVYGMEGNQCVNCGSKIKKIKVGGRGTHFCSHCQK